MARRAILLLPAALLLAAGCSKETLECLDNEECQDGEGCNQWNLTCSTEVTGWRCWWGDDDCEDDEGSDVFCVFADQAAQDAERGYCIRECRGGCPEDTECTAAPAGLGTARVCLPAGVTCAWRWRPTGNDDYERQSIGDCEP